MFNFFSAFSAGVALILVLEFAGKQTMAMDANTAAIQKPSVRMPGCNNNVCFVLDGSDMIRPISFRTQQRFVIRVTRELSEVSSDIQFSAIQFASRNRAISPLTGNVEEFITAVNSSEQLSTSPTFLTGGINYCFSQLFQDRTRNNKIVLLGSGENEIGADPVARARLFSLVAGNLITVGVGGNQSTEALESIAGDPSRAFSVSVGGRLRDVVPDVIDALCG